jgi:glycerol-3-phosphate dehydrogenase (NAD(P)+)
MACEPGPVAVIGAGAWGTTLACLWGRTGVPVRLWARRPDLAARIAETRENPERLAGVGLPPQVAPTADLAEAAQGVGIVVVAVPSAHVRAVAAGLAGHVPAEATIISATKGLEPDSGQRMSEVLREELGVEAGQLVALSGPNLSAEIAAGRPAVSVLAGSSQARVESCQERLCTPLFRLYASYDILGVELCGALKNVLAIAAGFSDGLDLGSNARAALITRGLAEMGRLGTRLGAERATFWGVAGVGDILATCTSPLSRNYLLGLRLARGETMHDVQRSHPGVAEGIPTTSVAHGLARRMGVEAPITAALYEVLFEGRVPADAVHDLMTRRWRAEVEEWQ